jgi:RNA polymerase sigma factor (sigma-70 family)
MFASYFHRDHDVFDFRQPGQGVSGALVAEARTQARPWVRLVEDTRNNEPAGVAELYRCFCEDFRRYSHRKLGCQDAQDRMHDAFLVTVEAIRAGELRNPERLVAFFLTVLRRKIAAHIHRVVEDRKGGAGLTGRSLRDARKNPEEQAIATQRTSILRSALARLPQRDCEILTRFYLLEHDPEQICLDMKLSPTQFRLLKSRAKMRLGELGCQKLRRLSPGSRPGRGSLPAEGEPERKAQRKAG